MDLNYILTTIVLFATLVIIGVFIYVGILLINNLKSLQRILDNIERTEELIKSIKDVVTIGFMRLAESFSPKKKKLKS